MCYVRIEAKQHEKREGTGEKKKRGKQKRCLALDNSQESITKTFYLHFQ